MRQRFNVACIPANVIDATSFYRSVGPLSQLRINRPSLQMQVLAEINWPSLAMNDAVMLQRPFATTHIGIAEYARKQGMPLWVDHDDNLFDIPFDNPCRDIFITPEAQSCIKKTLHLADVLTVSTEALVDAYAPHVRKGVPIEVVPNAQMVNLVGKIPRYDGTRRQKLVMWRGSDTHQRDLDAYTPEMIAASRALPHYKFLFHGYCTWPLIEGMGDRAERRKPNGIMDYFTALLRMGPRIVVVPLNDSTFNHGKSNIAWLEATYAGAVCLAPDWAEWQRPGVVNYKDRGEFFKKLVELMTWDDAQIDAQWKLSRDYIEKNLTIAKVNAKRSAIVDLLETLAADEDWRLARRQSVYDDYEAAMKAAA